MLNIKGSHTNLDARGNEGKQNEFPNNLKSNKNIETFQLFEGKEGNERNVGSHINLDAGGRRQEAGGKEVKQNEFPNNLKSNKNIETFQLFEGKGNERNVKDQA